MQSPGKTKLCFKFQAGHCSYGDRCQFAHGEQQLARVPGPPVEGDSNEPPPAFEYAVGAQIEEEAYLELFRSQIGPDVQLPAYKELEQPRKRVRLSRQQEEEALRFPGHKAPGFDFCLDRQERPVVCATHYKAHALMDLPAGELGQMLDCLAGRMLKITTAPDADPSTTSAVAAQRTAEPEPEDSPPGSEPAGPPPPPPPPPSAPLLPPPPPPAGPLAAGNADDYPAVIRVSCGYKDQGGWQRSWNLHAKGFVPVTDYLHQLRTLLQRYPGAAEQMQPAEYYSSRALRDLQWNIKEAVRPCKNNWKQVWVRSGEQPAGDVEAGLQGPNTEDSTAEQLAGDGEAGQQGSGDAAADVAGGGAAAVPPPGQDGPAPPAGAVDLSEHFAQHFFLLPQHLQPAGAGAGAAGAGSGSARVRWFGCRTSPVLLAVPDGVGRAAVALNGFSAEAAAKHAQDFVRLFGYPAPGRAWQLDAEEAAQPHRQKGFAVFFVPLYK